MKIDRRWLLPALAAVFLLVAACGDDDDDDAPATTAPTEAATSAPTEAATSAPTEAATSAPTEAATTAPTETATTAPTVAPSGETHALEIRDFSLPDLTIAVGDTVRWTNVDGTPHTTTGRNNEWDSGSMPDRSSFGNTFASAGSFEYYCTIHPNMVGTITVQ